MTGAAPSRSRLVVFAEMPRAIVDVCIDIGPVLTARMAADLRGSVGAELTVGQVVSA